MVEPKSPVPPSVWLRVVLLGVIVTAGGIYAFIVGLPSQAEVRELVADWGAAGVMVFVLGYAVVTLMPIPASALTILAGVLFGVVGGIAIGLVAATLGAYGGFWLGRLLGREAVERLIGHRVERVDALLRRRGLVAVLGIRLVPVVPFAAVNYVAGLTAVRQRDYVLGTVVGILPATVAYVIVGAYGASPLSMPFVLAVGSLVLLALGSWVWLHVVRRHPMYAERT
ncbi:MAG: TVP38/TMEM64 family protein [Mycobacteriaceae bacterium]